METTPDKWIIVSFTNNGNRICKVFATWAGGYLDGDSWKLNSGIKSVTEDDDYFYFSGYSGSTYKCHKKGYGVATSYSQSIIDKFQEVANKNGSNLIIFDENNWKEHIDK
jgi:hypothetical protein